MFTLAPFALAITAISSVSGLVVPRATAPAGWAKAYLEPYDTYHTRYLAIGCINKHDTAFFDQCCHPLLATQKLETARPKQCIPSTSTSSSKPKPTAVPDDDEYDDCDDEDEEPSTTVHATSTKAPTPTSTKIPVITSTKTPAVAPSPAKTSTTKASPTPQSSNVNSGGFATFFYQNGVAGACGTVHGDNDMIAAIDGHRYGNLNVKSALCGQKVQITNPANKKSVTVTIADACPTCKNGNSIDLSESAFKKIATLDEGMVGITWSFV
ncbi:plant expansin [Lyophyllum atratum]|nr:plant expansin [Lyophyllum atratum]